MSNISEVSLPHFRSDPKEYAGSQREWLAIFNEALKRVNQTGWEEWLHDPFHEGTPIFSRVNRKFNPPKGVVINQILPTDDDFSFRAYLDIFAPDSTEDMVEHVVIESILSDGSKRKAVELINAYLVLKLPQAEIVKLCEQLTTLRNA